MHTSTRLGLDTIDGTDNVKDYPTVDQQVNGILDNATLVTQGTLASRPAANTVEANHLYRPTDTPGVVFLSDGTNWQTCALQIQGTQASIPAAGVQGRDYYATDTTVRFRDNGSAWIGSSNFLSYVSTAGNYSALNGQLVGATVGSTVTLPGAALNSVVGIVTPTPLATPVTVAYGTGGGKIIGVGLNATSFQLGSPGSFSLLQCDGTNWRFLGGQQDTGWVSITPNSNLSGTFNARLRGDVVMLSGSLTAVTIVGGSITVGTLPANMTPTAVRKLGQDGTTFQFQATNTGSFIYNNSMVSGQSVTLDGLVFPVS